MNDLYATPKCVIHEVNITTDPDRCVKCDAVNRWVVPVTIDYEAAAFRIKEWTYQPEGETSAEELVREVFDAALGGDDET